MHQSVLLIHETDESYLMNKRHFDASEDDGAEIVFKIECSSKNAEETYAQYIKDFPESKKDYPDAETFFDEYHGYIKNDDGDYGYYSNILSIYDWYEVGGRWENLLPTYKNEKQLKKAVDEALNLKDKKVAAKYRDNLDEYVKVSEMSVMNAAAYLEIGGQNTIIISKDFSAQDIINWWKAKYKLKENHNAISEVITGCIIVEEENGEERYIDCMEITDELFIETYNHFLKVNKKGREFQITILDCHS